MHDHFALGDGDRIAGAFGYERERGRSCCSRSSGDPGHGGIGRAYKNHEQHAGKAPETGTRWPIAPGRS